MGVDALVESVTSLVVVAKTVLVRLLVPDEYLGKSVLVQSEGSQFTQYFEKLALNLTVLHPDFL